MQTFAQPSCFFPFLCKRSRRFSIYSFFAHTISDGEFRVPISIKDIAKKANVSPSTVSRALNDYPRISPETRKQIKELARSMGYIPSQAARNLVTQQSATIGVAVADYLDPFYAAKCAQECYKYYYYTHYPFDESDVMRPRRVSGVHHRLQDLGAVFGQKNGWERVNYFEPDRPWRRAGEEQRECGGWTQPAYFETVGRETEAVRKRAGIFDMTSFGKIELKGPGALPLIQRQC